AFAVVGGGGYTLFPQAELLSAAGAGRDAELRAAVNGRYLDARPQRRFAGVDRNGEIDIVRLAAEDRMVAGAGDDVEVAGGAAQDAGVAPAGRADALAVAGPGLQPHLERFRAMQHAFAVAEAARRPGLARAAAARALQIELHSPAGLRHLARAVAFRACLL